MKDGNFQLYLAKFRYFGAGRKLENDNFGHEPIACYTPTPGRAGETHDIK
jgi:hypothetical protein